MTEEKKVVPAVEHSSRLGKLLETRVNAAYEQADATCTAGYDNGGSTGREIFENGVSLGVRMAALGQNAYYGTAGYGAGSCFFVIAPTEDLACEKVEAWQEDE